MSKTIHIKLDKVKTRKPTIPGQRVMQDRRMKRPKDAKRSWKRESW